MSLSVEQARAIASFRFTETQSGPAKGLTHVVDVSPGSIEGTYSLRPGSIVGSVSIAGVSLNILPKAGVGKTAQMLAYSLGLARFLEDSAAFTDADSLPALLVPAFLSRTAEVVGQGLVEDYIPTSERGNRPRGKINFHSIATSGLPAPVEYVYDDFSADTPLNQLVVRGLHAVSDLHGLRPELHAEARRLLAASYGVSFIEWPTMYFGGDLPERTSHYREAVTLATLILQGAGVEPRASSRSARGMLFDMNRVFEDFVTAVIRRTKPEHSSVDVQGRLHQMFLDAERRYRLKPDFALWDRFGCCVVGDVKYKVLDRSTGPRRPDLYQMVNYASAAGTDRGLLIYVGTGPGTEVNISSPRIKIDVRAIDIDGDFDEIEERVRAMVEIG